MAIERLWFTWDGIYDLFGSRNQYMLDTSWVIGTKARLKRLGFYHGSLDPESSPEFHFALSNFRRYYWSAEEQKKWEAGMDSKGSTFMGEWIMNKRPPLPPLADACVDLGDVRQLLRKLEELCRNPREPLGFSAKPSGMSTRLNVSRTGPGRSSLIDGTVNVPDELAVRIVSAPSWILPFQEEGGIELIIRGYERVQSLLLRIYRNYDQVNEADRIPTEKLVYQEVLHRIDLESCARQWPHGLNRRVYSGPEAEMAERKRRHFNFPLQQQHAPYRMQVWVSVAETDFDVFADPEQWKTQIAKQAEPKQWEFKRTSRAVKFTAEPDPPGIPYPKAVRYQLVHDRSLYGGNTGETGEDPPPPPAEVAAERWPEIHKRRREAGFTGPPWTVQNAVSTNLIGTPCGAHPPDYLIQNREAEDPFIVENFRSRPLDTYLEVHTRHQASADGNFSYPEISATLQEIQKHIRRIKQRFCCGEYSSFPPALKQASGSFDVIDGEIGQLQRRSYPHRDCFYLIARFVEMWDWVVFYTKVYPELRWYQIEGIKDQGQTLTIFRNQQAFRTDGSTVNYAAQYVNHERGERTPIAIADICNSTAGARPRPIQWNDPAGSQVLRICRERILVHPSYNPLDDRFFFLTRQVPMFIIGIIDLQHLTADAHDYSPWEFFKHDMFHTLGNIPSTGGEIGPLNYQLFYTQRQRLTEIQQADSRRTDVSVYRIWDRNCERLRMLGDAQLDENTRHAFNTIMFCLTHEPMKTRDLKSYHPALLEPRYLQMRLNDLVMEKILVRAYDAWFGEPDDKIIEKYAVVFDLVKQNLGMLEDAGNPGNYKVKLTITGFTFNAPARDLGQGAVSFRMWIADIQQQMPVQNLDPSNTDYTGMTGFSRSFNLAATEQKLDFLLVGRHEPVDKNDLRQTLLGEITHRFENPHDDAIELNTPFYSVALQLERCS